jgi:hypothetical protein
MGWLNWLIVATLMLITLYVAVRFTSRPRHEGPGSRARDLRGLSADRVARASRLCAAATPCWQQS